MGTYTTVEPSDVLSVPTRRFWYIICPVKSSIRGEKNALQGLFPISRKKIESQHTFGPGETEKWDSPKVVYFFIISITVVFVVSEQTPPQIKSSGSTIAICIELCSFSTISPYIPIVNILVYTKVGPRIQGSHMLIFHFFSYSSRIRDLYIYAARYYKPHVRTSRPSVSKIKITRIDCHFEG